MKLLSAVILLVGTQSSADRYPVHAAMMDCFLAEARQEIANEQLAEDQIVDSVWRNCELEIVADRATDEAPPQQSGLTTEDGMKIRDRERLEELRAMVRVLLIESREQ